MSFKALGLLPQTTTQTGPLTITGPASYRVVLDGATRNFDVLYVDDRVRVVEFVPSDGRDKQLFVFERVQDEEEEEEEDVQYEEEEDEEDAARDGPHPAPGAAVSTSPPSLSSPPNHLATVVERDAAARDRRVGAAPPPAKAKAAARARVAPAPRARHHRRATPPAPSSPAWRTTPRLPHSPRSTRRQT